MVRRSSPAVSGSAWSSTSRRGRTTAAWAACATSSALRNSVRSNIYSCKANKEWKKFSGWSPDSVCLFLPCRDFCPGVKDFQGCGSDTFIRHLHPPNPTHRPGVPPRWKDQEGERKEGEGERERYHRRNVCLYGSIQAVLSRYAHRCDCVCCVFSAQRKKTSVASLDPEGLNVEVGDQVLVAGQKNGIVRFYGKTDFAPGQKLWDAG